MNMDNGISQQQERPRLVGGHVDAPRSSPLGLYRLEVLDDEAVRALDPILPRTGYVVRLAAPWTAPVVVTKGGKDVLRLEPTDAGQEALDLNGAMYNLIVEALGDDTAPKSSIDRWRKEAVDWGVAAMRDTPSTAMDRWRGLDAARLDQIADRLSRSFLLPKADVEALIGRPMRSTRGLWPVGHDAARLEAKEREQLRQADASRAEAAERSRARTMAERGLDGVAVLRGRLVASTEAPFHGAIPAWETESHAIYAWTKLPGLSLPSFEEHGVRSLWPDETVPNARVAPEPTTFAVGFIQEVRARFGRLELGPIPREKLGLAGLRLAREFIATRGPVFIYGPSAASQMWKARWAIEVLVRGYLLFPELAAELAIGARDSAHLEAYPDTRYELDAGKAERAIAATNPPEREWVELTKLPDGRPVRVRDEPPPTASRTHFDAPNPARFPASRLSTDPLATMAVAAVASGSVGAGELLDTSEQPMTGKKEKR